MIFLQPFKRLVAVVMQRWPMLLAAPLFAMGTAIARTLAWLDSGHPMADRVIPVLRFLSRHPKRISASIAALLLATGGGAFAVANLGPDAAELPVSTLTETVTVASLDQQAQALELRNLQLLRSETTRSADTADSLMRRMGLSDPQAASFLRQHGAARDALSRPGRSVTALANDQQQLTELTVRWLRNESDSVFQRLVVRREGSDLYAKLESVPLNASIRMAGGTVNSSLFAASDEARLPDAVVSQLTDIFSTQIDFHRMLRKGARFSVVYEVLEADGEPLRPGKVLSAEFINGNKTYEAVWFQPPGGKGSYYSLNGQSLRRAYIAAPVAYSRKTSGFSMRLHPIFQTVQAHRGIDYAAPTGTPVASVGDGVVDFAGVQGGYGNVVTVRHGSNHSTVYGHLSKINVRKGQAVTQGQIIGAVGSTGWSTGPHLHFEFRVAGKHVDPQSIIQQAQSGPVPAAERNRFNAVAREARQSLMAAAQMRSTETQ